MKLRNKKTGEIGELMTENYEFDGFWVRTGGDNYPDHKDINYYSLAELNEDWEDYEEPKAYWYIDDAGVIQIDQILSSEINMRKSIGNYFETKEEAEKAAEKLKALQRLKKKFDLHITGWDVLDNQVIITTDCDLDYVRDRQDDGLWDDLDLVFNGNLLIGGEE